MQLSSGVVLDILATLRALMEITKITSKSFFKASNVNATLNKFEVSYVDITTVLALKTYLISKLSISL